jgi:hypothetical protein
LFHAPTALHQVATGSFVLVACGTGKVTGLKMLPKSGFIALLASYFALFYREN